jgi:hypothetical protein
MDQSPPSIARRVFLCCRPASHVARSQGSQFPVPVLPRETREPLDGTTSNSLLASASKTALMLTRQRQKLCAGGHSQYTARRLTPFLCVRRLPGVLQIRRSMITSPTCALGWSVEPAAARPAAAPGSPRQISTVFESIQRLPRPRLGESSRGILILGFRGTQGRVT